MISSAATVLMVGIVYFMAIGAGCFYSNVIFGPLFGWRSFCFPNNDVFTFFTFNAVLGGGFLGITITIFSIFGLMVYGCYQCKKDKLGKVYLEPMEQHDMNTQDRLAGVTAAEEPDRPFTYAQTDEEMEHAFEELARMSGATVVDLDPGDDDNVWFATAVSAGAAPSQIFTGLSEEFMEEYRDVKDIANDKVLTECIYVAQVLSRHRLLDRSCCSLSATNSIALMEWPEVGINFRITLLDDTFEYQIAQFDDTNEQVVFAEPTITRFRERQIAITQFMFKLERLLNPKKSLFS